MSIVACLVFLKNVDWLKPHLHTLDVLCACIVYILCTLVCVFLCVVGVSSKQTVSVIRVKERGRRKAFRCKETGTNTNTHMQVSYTVQYVLFYCIASSYTVHVHVHVFSTDVFTCIVHVLVFHSVMNWVMYHLCHMTNLRR